LEYTVYVIYSKKFDKIYIGYTSNLEKRIISHNHKLNKGWTKRYQPWELIYKEAYPDKKTALRREKELKSYKGRLFIRELQNEKSL
jgi:putative endonuclease